MFMIGGHFGYCLDPCKRRFRANPMVSTIGFSQRNACRSDGVHRKLNFCFILRGSGFLHIGRKRYTVKAPCVIVITPGIHTRHGAKTDWDEVYFSYPRCALAQFQARGLYASGQPVWPIDNLPAVEQGLMSLRESLQDLHVEGRADLIDWLCAGLILRSHLSDPPLADRNSAEAAIQRIRAYFETHYREPIAVRELVQSQGLSYSHFARLWSQRFAWAPTHYILALRIGEACRLLTETKLRMKEIALQVGFGDPYHFSRRFHQMTGETALSYRKTHVWVQPHAGVASGDDGGKV